MTIDTARARTRALQDLQREARYFREQAALASDVPDVQALWLALAEQLDRYVEATRTDPAGVVAGSLPLFELHPP